MTTAKRTISVRLDAEAKKRVERAARIMKQSSGRFLEKAGERQARDVLLAWSVDQHRGGMASFSELAEETGLPIEEIMLAMSAQGADEALDMFLASCRSVAEARGDSAFLRAGEEAVDLVRRSRQRP